MHLKMFTDCFSLGFPYIFRLGTPWNCMMLSFYSQILFKSENFGSLPLWKKTQQNKTSYNPQNHTNKTKTKITTEVYREKVSFQVHLCREKKVFWMNYIYYMKKSETHFNLNVIANSNNKWKNKLLWCPWKFLTVLILIWKPLLKECRKERC